MSQSKDLYFEVTPPKGFINLNLSELWHFRDLLYIFVWRDIKVRYKQTLLGVAWAILQPFLTMLIFTLIFGRIVNTTIPSVPYPVFVFVGLVVWTYFSLALTSTSNSMIESESIIKKVYFPRLILPLSTVVTPIIDFAIATVILLLIMAYYHYLPHIFGLIILPLLLLITMLTALGVGLFLASLNVKFRDVRYIVPFLLQLLLFTTPVIYPASAVIERFEWWLYVNPLAGVITAARSAFFAPEMFHWSMVVGAGIVSLVFFFGGLIYFKRTERTFADIL